MAVKKMKLLNIVVPRNHETEVLRWLLLEGKTEFLDANALIDETGFLLSADLEYADEILEMNMVNPYERDVSTKHMQEQLDYILEVSDYKPKFLEDYVLKSVKVEEDIAQLDRMHKELVDLNNERDNLLEELELIEDYKILTEIPELSVNYKKLFSLENFKVKIGHIRFEERIKLERNAENIPPIFIHLNTDHKGDIVLFAYPNDLEVETTRILRSINFVETELDKKYLSDTEEMIHETHLHLGRVKDRLMEVKLISRNYVKNNRQKIDEIYSQLHIEELIDSIAENIAVTDHFTYFSLWVPRDDADMYTEHLKKYTNCVVNIVGTAESGMRGRVPTFLSNSWLFRPFEELVKMYGVPSYNEIDPTVFFGVTYMLLFGAMFGDLGQGLIIFLAGKMLSRKMGPIYTGLLKRIGVASMVFGFFYDSFLGYEHVISSVIPLDIFIRPLENINTMLITSVAFGGVLLTISYVFSIINKIRKRDYEEGIFGRNGITGYLLFVVLVMKVLEVVLKVELLGAVFIPVLLILVLLLFLKEPITRYFLEEKPYIRSKKSEYFVESGFDIVETFLSLLSNSVSFIRVGAFALNHVGLFVAFHTLADMIGGFKGNLIMFIVGNALVIALEGLVVFIQGLRLLYYELFSKYYDGEGRLFDPVKINV